MISHVSWLVGIIIRTSVVFAGFHGKISASWWNILSDVYTVSLSLSDIWQNLAIDNSYILPILSFTGVLAIYAIDRTPEVCGLFRMHFLRGEPVKNQEKQQVIVELNAVASPV